VAFGLLSLAVALPFLVAQGDLKRLLAYSSIEHMGLLTIAYPAARADLELATDLFRVFREQPTSELIFVNLHAMELADDSLIAPDAPLSRHAGRVVLEVTDHGRGFAPDAADAAPGGLGLASMRERAAAAGGLLAIRSAPGQGTVVRLAVPVNAARARAARS